ncbi:MAG: hypothetical protein DI598_05115 [Pseudopedobacter saltans]|uniref:Uncharacterized protein n=1 Tax=Pseudopedobacter saltans TaxID=151895 RepID=A0A2W5F9X5_9SPHI|nr:MAG: hypothetical protein DI598_05115 [Pseudopedobacter saltans]
MKTVITLLISILCWNKMSQAQNTATGSVNIPALQSIRADNLQSSNIDFTKLSDYHDGVEIKSFCKLTIKCNYAWKLKIQVVNTSYNGKIPVGVVSVRLPGNNKYIPISENATTVLVCNNDNISNEYLVNLRIDPKLQFNNLQSIPFNLTYILEHQ